MEREKKISLTLLSLSTIPSVQTSFNETGLVLHILNKNKGSNFFFFFCIKILTQGFLDHQISLTHTHIYKAKYIVLKADNVRCWN